MNVDTLQSIKTQHTLFQKNQLPPLNNYSQKQNNTRKNFHQQSELTRVQSMSATPVQFISRSIQSVTNSQQKPLYQLPKIDSSKPDSVSPNLKNSRNLKDPQNQTFADGSLFQMKSNKQQMALNIKKQSYYNSEGYYKFYAGFGNNEDIIKRVMSRRTWWKETRDHNSMSVNFKWQQSNRGFRYDRLISSQTYRQLVNHFQHHSEITNKEYLLKNLTTYCENFNLNVFDYVPLTFMLDFSNDDCDFNINMFLKIYEQFLPNELKKAIPEGLQKYMLEIKRKLRGNFIFQFGMYQYKDQVAFHFQQFKGTSTKYKITDTFFNGDNGNYLWLLKPTFLNRGRGIHIFSDLKILLQLIQEYQEGYVEKIGKVDKGEELTVTPEKEKRSVGSIIKANSFVVQKYIEQPALINSRKFDIRVWALLTHKLDIYFFRFLEKKINLKVRAILGHRVNHLIFQTQTII